MNIFNKARAQLTVRYLIIMMGISIFFSFIIYRGATAELRRIEFVQGQRRPTIGIPFAFEPEVIEETKRRILLSLLTTNVVILGLSTVAGYLLAGEALNPIREMVEEQKEFVASASHELRTPLTSLRAEIEVGLRDKKLRLADAKALLVSNLEEVGRMQKLSNYLLTLNKFQSGNGNLTRAAVNLGEIARVAVGKVEKLAKMKNIIIATNLQSTQVEVNADSVTELAVVLLDNAIKYSDKGGRVNIKTEKKTLEIADNGMGISKRDLPNVFDRFYRADPARSKVAVEGFGLGLAIAKSIADFHGAQMKVKSKVGKGTTFKVVFP